MKTGMLYRSDDISRITEHDLERLIEYKIKVICDLRTPKEHQAKQSHILPHGQFHVFHIPLHLQETGASKRQWFDFFFGKSGDEHFKKFSRAYYHHMAIESTLQIREIITLVSREENLPALIHCTAGKDRTGYISAVIQLLAKVPYERVVQDYLLTNDYYKARLESVIKMMRWMTLFQVTPERMKLILMANREFLDEVYRGLMETYGSIEMYLNKGCGIELCTLRKFKELLLE